MKVWIVVCGDQEDAAGRELDDLVVTCGNDDTDLNLRTIRDLTILGRYVVAESATEVSWCANEACSAWDVFVANYENGTPTTGQKYVAEYDVDNDLSDLGPRLYCLSFGTFASELSNSETTGREPDDRVVVLGYDVSNHNTWKTCDLTTLGSSAVAVSATEIFSCAYDACNARDGSAGQKYDAEYDVADDLTGAFSSHLSKGATEYFDLDFESILFRTRSNTTSDRDLDKIVFQDVILPSSCPASPRDLRDSLREDDQRKDKISTRHHRNMTAAVILDEIQRRSLIPRDMIRLVQKGKMISGEKTMKENNIEAKATIEMSLRLLGGMEVNEQMDTHETEEDREKKES